MYMYMKNLLLLFLITCCLAIPSSAQQAPDTTFTFEIENPKYAADRGPTICIDSAHHNFHTIDGGYAPTAKVLRADGYRVADLSEKIYRFEFLKSCKVYMIVNPLHESNHGNWQLPTPSAFSATEIDLIKSWVEAGGSLFLIADHLPFAGAANALSSAFDFEMSNGFAYLASQQERPDHFTVENGRLLESPVSDGITTITTFTGSAFTYPENAYPVLVFTDGDYSLEPIIAWQFNESTTKIDIKGYAQGALLEEGNGRVAMFGEAAMFTAQTVTSEQGTFKIGINSERLAPQNIQFLQNIIYWLDN